MALEKRNPSYSALSDDETSEQGIADRMSTWAKRAGPTLDGIAVAFQDVSYKLVRRKLVFSTSSTQVLSSVSGYVQPGETLLLMGPTGSGKSSLLELLAGRSSPSSGTITFGGRPASVQFSRRFVSYMEQQDSLLGMLTVREQLSYTGDLKLGRTVPFHRKKQRADELLIMLQLDHVVDVKCKDLSQGQLRRTSLAVALLSKPRVLLLDEPCRASDAASQDLVLQVLHEMCESEQVSVVVAMTQPTSYAFERFDMLLMLLEGRCVYFGGCGGQAVDYFANYGFKSRPGDSAAESAAKAARQLLRLGDAGKVAHEYEASPLHARAVEQVEALAGRRLAVVVEAGGKGAEDDDEGEDRDNGKGGEPAKPRHLGKRASKHTVAPFWYALLVLWRYRGLHNYLRAGWLLPRFADKLLFAVIIALLFKDAGQEVKVTMLVTVPAANFLLVVIPAFSAVCCLPSIFTERRTFYRERHDGMYSTATFLTYKLTEELVLVIAYSVAVSAIVFFVVGMRGSFVLFWLVYMAVNFVSISFAYLVAAVSRNGDVATVLVPTFAWLMLFFAGFLVAVQVIPGYLRWLSYMDHLRYGYAALQENHWGQMDMPLVGDSLSGKIGAKVNTLVQSLPEKLGIPFLGDPAPAPGAGPDDEGFLSGLVNDLKDSASGAVKDLVGSVAETAVEAVADVSVDAVKDKINSTIYDIVQFSGRANATMHKVFTQLETVTYGDVALAIYDFGEPYNPWINWVIQMLWFVGFTLLTYLAMVFIKHPV